MVSRADRKQLIKLQWKGKPGHKFEDLVGTFLAEMFPDIEFRHTEYNHDGGKDFYAVGGGPGTSGIWVEAKNYNRHLELSKFSNTFIMADISQINRIILFSMSPLTEGARINIARYGAYQRKYISIYAGDDIIRLLQMYRSRICLEDFIENAEEVLTALRQIYPDLHQSEPISVSYEYYQTNQFNLSYHRTPKSCVKEQELHKLPLYSIVAQEIQIANNDLLHHKTIRFQRKPDDLNVFEVYLSQTPDGKLTLPPASTTILVVYYRIVGYTPTIKMPILDFGEQDISVENNEYPFTCCWLGEIPYIGSGLETLTSLMRSLECSAHRSVIISGKSGVGKSRFLREFAAELYMHNYKIIDLDFRSFEGLSLKSMLQHILRNIFFLDASHPEEMSLVPAFDPLADSLYTLYKDFYSIIFDNSYDCQANLDGICARFCSLLQNESIALLLDNVQDLTVEAISFFRKVMEEVNNCGQLHSVVALCFNKDFLPPQKEATRFYNRLMASEYCYQALLVDFSQQEAERYLEECLDPGRRRRDFSLYIQKIIQKFGSNPFILKQVVLYLKQRRVINFEGSLIYISDLAAMKIALEELPEGVSKILDARYEYLLRDAPQSERDFNRIIWSTLFFGALPRRMLHLLGLKQSNANGLIEYGFAAYNDLGELVLSHQFIEQNFCLRFMGASYAKTPCLTFLEHDDNFLRLVLDTIEAHYSTLFEIQNMLLRHHLGCSEETLFCKAMLTLSSASPRGIMLPMIIDTLLDTLSMGIKIPAEAELRAIRSLCIVCQDRYDVLQAANMTRSLIKYEQQTYQNKLEANKDFLELFKYYVFQLPVDKKFLFLDWLLKEAKAFMLPQETHHRFCGWLHNRYGKNLCSVHRLDEAVDHIEAALSNALERDDYESAAEAEIEYGNISAYLDAEDTARHWEQSVRYIQLSGSKTIYFTVFRLGYSILVKLLRHDLDGIQKLLPQLQELRTQTFLYQRLFIDDVCADYYLMQYAQGDADIQKLLDLLPQLIMMQDESHMHTPIFSLLADYKLLTVYRLLDCAEAKDEYQENIFNLLCELTDNGIFSGEKLAYAKMILQDLAVCCANRPALRARILQKLPQTAENYFSNMLERVRKEGALPATTILHDRERTLNLLTFNYVF